MNPAQLRAATLKMDLKYYKVPDQSTHHHVHASCKNVNLPPLRKQIYSSILVEFFNLGGQNQSLLKDK